MEKNVEVSLLLDFYGELLNSAGREMTYLYYNDDLSLAEIAEEFGITRQGVRDRIKRCEKQLFEYENKLGLFGRFGVLEQGLDKIASDAEKIRSLAENKTVIDLAQGIRQRAISLKE